MVAQSTTVEPDFHELFDATPACVLALSPDLTIVGVSDAYLRATLTTRADLLGRKLFDAFPDNPEDPEATGVRNLSQPLERVLVLKQPDRMPIQKYDIARPEAEGGAFEERYWSPLNTPVLDANGAVRYILHHVEDVTSTVWLERRGREQDRAIRELSIQGEERLRRVLDAAPDAMLVVDSSARIRFANAQAEKVFGYAQAELLALKLESLLPVRSRTVHAVHLERYFRNPSHRSMDMGLDLCGLRKDGSEVPIEVSLSPLPLDGETCVMAAIRDTTQRRELEGKAKSMAMRLGSALESIQDAFAIFDEGDRLFPGRISMSIEPVAVRDVLQRVHNTLAPIAAKAGLALDVSDVGDELPSLAADATRLAQILMNLCRGRHTSRVASTAEQGIELARSLRPHVVIMDINLPGMSGVDALRVLRASSETASIPVIALTAAASEKERRLGEELGFHRYLTKPLRVVELEDVLATLIP